MQLLIKFCKIQFNLSVEESNEIEIVVKSNVQQQQNNNNNDDELVFRTGMGRNHMLCDLIDV